MAALAPLWIVRRHVVRVLPLVHQELAVWEEKARAIPDPALRRQAAASLAHKRFHCEGGAVFAAWSGRGSPGAPSQKSRAVRGAHGQPPGFDGRAVVRFIVAFQTISDYLDNLCDRTGRLDVQDFRRLHQSMLDAVSPDAAAQGDYYRHRPNRDDGGYLESLVDACRRTLSTLPRYVSVQERVVRLVRLYVDLQCFKHAEHHLRVPTLERWFAEHAAGFPDLFWWEFAAASGSTLGVFALVADAARPSPVEAAERLAAAYFPWICGAHILLDYFIDQMEDVRERDLNFVSFYADRDEMVSRMAWIVERAIESARSLQDPAFHLAVVEGLLGLYLSSPKVREQGLGDAARKLLGCAGWRAFLVHAYCRRYWRRAAGAGGGKSGGA